MPDVTVYRFKDFDMKGGTLVVSVPGQGIGNVILTDFMLEDQAMDHLASLDAPGLPPVAMIHEGKARFPVRIHADPKTRIAVLRSETPVIPRLGRPMAQALVSWAKDIGLRRIVVLDMAFSSMERPGDGVPIVYTTAEEELFEMADKSGLERFGDGTVVGLTAGLLLEARLDGIETIGLLAAMRSPEDDLQSVMAYAKAIVPFVPGLELDTTALAERVKDMEAMVRDLQDQVRSAVQDLRKKGGEVGSGSEPYMYL